MRWRQFEKIVDWAAVVTVEAEASEEA